MERLKEAIIDGNGIILCPYCLKKNGELSGNEIIKNFKVRCRGSNGRSQHHFLLNVDPLELEVGK